MGKSNLDSLGENESTAVGGDMKIMTPEIGVAFRGKQEGQR